MDRLEEIKDRLKRNGWVNKEDVEWLISEVRRLRKAYTGSEKTRLDYLNELNNKAEEIERLKKGYREVLECWKLEVDNYKEQLIGKNKDIQQLKKEKEWLEYKVLESSQKHHTGKSYDEKIAMLNDEMQQALKEE